MNPRWVVRAAALAMIAGGAMLARGDEKADKAALAQKLWPKDRIQAALKAVDQQRADGLLSDAAYQKRAGMLKGRLAGAYEPQALAVTDPPLNFIQNGGFEQINRNSGKNRSRWLWWGGWDWGGDYENMWDDRPEYVHSGQFSARIRCVGKKGRIGISTPGLPAVPGATAYTLTFWARGDGENMLFVNFEGGSRGELRQKFGPEWKQYTVSGTPEPSEKTFSVYFYHIGEGTIWIDDVALVPVGGKLEEE